MVAIERACLVSGAAPAGRTIRLGSHGATEMGCRGALESDGTRTDDYTRQGSAFDLRAVRTAWVMRILLPGGQDHITLSQLV
jgi:hypothetical protein